MTVVDPASQLAALIRVQVASLRQRQQSGRSASAKPAPPTIDTAEGAPDLAAVVAKRIRALESTDPQRARKAFRIFLETVILSELGQDLVNDPSFPLMLDHVQQQMESDPDLAQAASDAAQVLLATADGGGPATAP